jgi:hypothetical protein
MIEIGEKLQPEVILFLAAVASNKYSSLNEQNNTEIVK